MLKGQKSYFIALAIAAVEMLYQLNYINQEVRNMILVLLGAGGTATLAAKINRVEKKVLLFILFFGLAGYGSLATTSDQPQARIVFKV